MRRTLFSYASVLVAVMVTVGVPMLSIAGATTSRSTAATPPLPRVRYGTESIDSAPIDALRVAPTRLTFTNVSPGSTHVTTITIRNRRSAITRFTLDVAGLAGSADPLQRVTMLAADDPATRSTARSWITLGASTVTLSPRQFATIPIRVTVPRTARPGGHYAAVVVRAQAAQLAIPGSNGGRLGVETEMAVAVLATIPGSAHRSIRIASFHAPSMVTSHHRLHATLLVENSGDIHADPRGVATIRSILGSDVARTPLRTRTLLPKGRDRVELTWKHAPWFGHYTITAAVGAGATADGDRASRGVWIVPPWWMLAGGLVIVAAGIGWMIRRRHSDDQSDSDQYDE